MEYQYSTSPPQTFHHVQEERSGEETEEDQQAGGSERQAVGEAGETRPEVSQYSVRSA